MKIKILLLLLVTVGSVTAHAQKSPSFGVKAGVISAGIKGDAVDNLQNLLDFTDGKVTTSNRTGVFLGGYANIPLGGAISVEPGIYYSQKGYEMNGELGIKGLEFLGANAKAQLRADYIDVPVLLKANIGGGLQLFAGPQISYLSSAKLATKASVLGINLLNKTFDATNQFNRWDMGVIAGLGYQFTNGINISASYDYGLSKVDANKNINSYNNSFKVGLGINF